MYQSYMCSFVMWIDLKAIKFHGIFFLSFLRESCGYFGFGSRNRMQSFQMLAHQHSNGVNVRIILSYKILLNWKNIQEKKFSVCMKKKTTDSKHKPNFCWGLNKHFLLDTTCWNVLNYQCAVVDTLNSFSLVPFQKNALSFIWE